MKFFNINYYLYLSFLIGKMAEASKEPGEESKEQAKEMLRISHVMDGSIYPKKAIAEDYNKKIRQWCEEFYECLRLTKSNTYSIVKLGFGEKIEEIIEVLAPLKGIQIKHPNNIMMIVSEDEGSTADYEIIVFQDSVLSIAYVIRDIIFDNYRYTLESVELSNISFCKFYERYGYDITQTLFEKIGYKNVRDELRKLLK